MYCRVMYVKSRRSLQAGILGIGQSNCQIIWLKCHRQVFQLVRWIVKWSIYNKGIWCLILAFRRLVRGIQSCLTTFVQRDQIWLTLFVLVIKFVSVMLASWTRFLWNRHDPNSKYTSLVPYTSDSFSKTRGTDYVSLQSHKI